MIKVSIFVVCLPFVISCEMHVAVKPAFICLVFWFFFLILLTQLDELILNILRNNSDGLLKVQLTRSIMLPLNLHHIPVHMLP